MHRRIRFAIWFANFMKNVITHHFYKWTVQIFDCLCYKNGVVIMHNIKIGDQINPMTNKKQTPIASWWRCFVVRFKKNKNEFCSFFEKDSNKDRSIFLIVHAESRCRIKKNSVRPATFEMKQKTIYQKLNIFISFLK